MVLILGGAASYFKNSRVKAQQTSFADGHSV